MLHALTAACQNNYNCKAVAKQDVASLAARLLFNNSNEVVFDAVCLLYTLTTESEARLAVGQALVKTAGSGGSVAVDQLFAIVTGRDAGVMLTCDTTSHQVMYQSCWMCLKHPCGPISSVQNTGISNHCCSSQAALDSGLKSSEFLSFRVAC